MSTRITNIHVKDSADAFNVAARFMPGDWNEDTQSSARGGACRRCSMKKSVVALLILVSLVLGSFLGAWSVLTRARVSFDDRAGVVLIEFAGHVFEHDAR